MTDECKTRNEMASKANPRSSADIHYNSSESLTLTVCLESGGGVLGYTSSRYPPATPQKASRRMIVIG